MGNTVTRVPAGAGRVLHEWLGGVGLFIMVLGVYAVTILMLHKQKYFI